MHWPPEWAYPVWQGGNAEVRLKHRPALGGSYPAGQLEAALVVRVHWPPEWAYPVWQGAAAGVRLKQTPALGGSYPAGQLDEAAV